MHDHDSLASTEEPAQQHDVTNHLIDTALYGYSFRFLDFLWLGEGWHRMFHFMTAPWL